MTERHTITLEWDGGFILEELPADFIVTYFKGEPITVNLERVYMGTLQIVREDVERIIGADEITRQENLLAQELCDAREMV